jgi:phosphoserine phosphatase RsbU/P
MRLYFRWKLFFGFFGFALFIAALLVAVLLLEVSGGHLTAAGPEVTGRFLQRLRPFLFWAMLALGCVSIPPALWIASRLNRPIRLLHEAMQRVTGGNLDTRIPRTRTYDEFEVLIHNFNRMVAGLRERAQLLAERDRFLAHSLDLICLAGADGYFKEVNPAFQRVLGYSQEELLSRPFFDLVHAEDMPATAAEFEKLKSGAPTLSFVNRYRCADGSHRWLEWSAVPVPDRQLLFAIARDITDRKRGEEAERALIETRLQLGIAREIQRSLLPAGPPALAEFDIAGASHPAEEVGGDYYDYLPMREGRLGVVVSDVAGHGIGSALVMAATRACLRSLAAAGYGLEEILDCADKMLHDSTPDNCFVTMALAEIDPTARRLRYVNCGHSSGFLLDEKGAVKGRLASTAPPLGCLQDFTVGPVQELPMEAGDILVLLTDGVTEAESPDKRFFGDRRVLEVVRSHLEAPAESIVDAIHHAAKAFCEAEGAQDDITSVVVKVGRQQQAADGLTYQAGL